MALRPANFKLPLRGPDFDPPQPLVLQIDRGTAPSTATAMPTRSQQRHVLEALGGWVQATSATVLLAPLLLRTYDTPIVSAIEGVWRMRGKLSSMALLVGAYAAVLAGRLYLTALPPINSTDLLRYVGFGRQFWRYGLAIYGQTPRAFGDVPYADLWPDLPFIYPAVALLFFAGTSAILPNLLFPRLVLTAIELLNALLAARLTRSRLFGLIYFLNPVSLWWYSREGQYEPLVALLCLAALLALEHRSRLSVALVALGIQAKYWPGALMPTFLRREWRPRAYVYAALALLPSLAFLVAGQYVLGALTNPAMARNCNPYTWFPWDPSRTCWTPGWHLTLNAIATYGMLAAAMLAWVTEPKRLAAIADYLPLVVFLVYLKSSSWATAWYLPMCAVFALPIRRPWLRWAILLLGCLEPIAWAGLAGRPIGWLNPDPPWQYVWGLIP